MSLRNKIISGLNKTNDQCMHIYNYIADYVIKNKENHPFLYEDQNQNQTQLKQQTSQENLSDLNVFTLEDSSLNPMLKSINHNSNPQFSVAKICLKDTFENSDYQYLDQSKFDDSDSIYDDSKINYLKLNDFSIRLDSNSSSTFV